MYPHVHMNLYIHTYTQIQYAPVAVIQAKEGGLILLQQRLHLSFGGVVALRDADRAADDGKEVHLVGDEEVEAVLVCVFVVFLNGGCKCVPM